MVIILGAVLLLVWARFPEFKSFGQGDPYLDANQYITGKNFGERGFITENFLPDYATGPEDCHPLWYTHNPSFSEILSGIYYQLGLHDISQHRPIAILWNLLSAWFFYLLLKQLSSPRTALIALAVFISNPLYIAWGDNLNIHHQWCFIFAGMYFFLLIIDPVKHTKLFLSLAALCFFLLCYSNYEYVPFVAIFFVGVKILKIREIPWSRIIILLGTGLAAIIIHQLWVIRAIGFDYWLIDKAESLLHRTGMGVTPLMEVYNKIPCLMWEEQARFHGSYTLSNYWTGFYLHLEKLFGYGWTLLLLGICFIPGLLLPGEKEERSILRRSLSLFFLMSIFWFIVFVQHTADHQWGSTILLFAPFAAFLSGAVLSGVYDNFICRNNPAHSEKQKEPGSVKIIGILLILIIAGGLIAGRIINYRPFAAYPGIKALDKYRGKYFITSSIPTLISACTGTPTGWMAGKHPARIFSHSRYLVNPDCELYFQPDYFFSPQHPEDPNFAGRYDNWLSANFEIEEKGDNYTIYNLKNRLKNSNATILTFLGWKYIHEQIPRAVRARLQGNKNRRRYHSQSNFSKEKQLSDIIAQKILGLTDITQITKYTDDTNDITLKAATENLFSASSPVYASSEIGEDADIYNLFYPNPGRYWHVALDKIGESAWVMIDLGEDQKKIVNFIRTKPRPDTMQQSFKTAVIQGSPDAKSWKNIAAIITEDPPETRDWKGWYFLNNTPYRFYRFLVLDGHEVNGAFYSLGAMEMYHVINSRQGSKKWGIGNGG